MSEHELTLAMIKPDTMNKGLAPVIEQAFIDAGLEIIYKKILQLTMEQARTITGKLRERHLMPLIESYLTSGESEVLLLKGENAIQRTRNLIGYTKLSNREGAGLRGLYAENYLYNAIHGSATPEELERDILTLIPEVLGERK
ncbi:MAG: Nucleoside diphosphate kinase [Candidatus Daviesbacteria bacterium GW2011_GWA1_41_61]|uniref:Nucleoside diphosphate kinase n=1 Tax=Candidatus Daviesbacteria bacterium GW2011_GWA2_40_9 TaxID=1618424 RepID=A0A0G0WF93_9BACT|nr:MAG: Nucleoside diphosphate kinase [Candidatus Daviesbacteria bacterium GW2011_GWC1_40_9]KKR82965.1 MAG: Nucleoside diphosphate kinase [Candidatus Daviesbacteria bacterium GW2011_GWA2_40_9]KKR92892.1 MAG: Nucleoside diphosphate kinase [Candidatus Daviesbacteria bacterium GW2011_GWB1_41_15]KKS15436.1 MAG: Nucleoside diphosphate kinase [Candidatus Daviesbacteria bacterium GW2011_GWA1_41_61]